MKCPDAVLFDLDDTLAESFQPPSREMLECLCKLLEFRPVAILSAAGFPRIERDFLDTIATSKHPERFYVLPNSTTQAYVFRDGAWAQVYDIAFTEADRAKIVIEIEKSVAETKIQLDPAYEPRIINMDSKVAYAALGLNATAEAKAKWDPDASKRATLQKVMARRLPDFEVIIGGRTTIDVLPKGMNKAYGVGWLSKELGIAPGDMLFIGDAFYPGGNDYVVIPTGIQIRPVSGPEETLKVIDELLVSCA